MTNRRVHVSREWVRGMVHDQIQYASLLTQMSMKTASQAASRPEALASLRAIKAIVDGVLGRIQKGIDELDEEEVTAQAKKHIAGFMATKEWRRMQRAVDEKDLIFTRIRDAESENSPGSRCFEVALTRDCMVFGDWLLGRKVTVDGETWQAIGVEWPKGTVKPYRAGLTIKLVVKPIEAVPEDKPIRDEPRAVYDLGDRRSAST